jgi:hypothetical protein
MDDSSPQDKHKGQYGKKHYTAAHTLSLQLFFSTYVAHLERFVQCRTEKSERARFDLHSGGTSRKEAPDAHKQPGLLSRLGGCVLFGCGILPFHARQYLFFILPVHDYK